MAVADPESYLPLNLHDVEIHDVEPCHELSAEPVDIEDDEIASRNGSHVKRRRGRTFVAAGSLLALACVAVSFARSSWNKQDTISSNGIEIKADIYTSTKQAYCSYDLDYYMKNYVEGKNPTSFRITCPTSCGGNMRGNKTFSGAGSSVCGAAKFAGVFKTTEKKELVTVTNHGPQYFYVTPVPQCANSICAGTYTGGPTSFTIASGTATPATPIPICSNGVGDPLKKTPCKCGLTTDSPFTCTNGQVCTVSPEKVAKCVSSKPAPVFYTSPQKGFCSYNLDYYKKKGGYVKGAKKDAVINAVQAVLRINCPTWCNGNVHGGGNVNGGSIGLFKGDESVCPACMFGGALPRYPQSDNRYEYCTVTDMGPVYDFPKGDPQYNNSVNSGPGKGFYSSFSVAPGDVKFTNPTGTAPTTVPDKCTKSSECPLSVPLCVSSKCVKMQCPNPGFKMDGYWEDSWKSVHAMFGRYTALHLKYSDASGCLCLFNDWISSHEEICKDNYNKFSFQIFPKSGGADAQSTLDIWLYGDETIKIAVSGKVIMKRGDENKLGRAAFGYSYHLPQTKHTTYELCIPVGEPGTEMQMNLKDPTAIGDYTGTCVSTPPKPENPIDITIPEGGGPPVVVPVCLNRDGSPSPTMPCICGLTAAAKTKCTAGQVCTASSDTDGKCGPGCSSHTKSSDCLAPKCSWTGSKCVDGCGLYNLETTCPSPTCKWTGASGIPCVDAPCNTFTSQPSCPSPRCKWSGSSCGDPDCPAFTSETSCPSPRCEWSGTACRPPECNTHTSQGLCPAPQCEWVSNACRPVCSSVDTQAACPTSRCAWTGSVCVEPSSTTGPSPTGPSPTPPPTQTGPPLTGGPGCIGKPQAKEVCTEKGMKCVFPFKYHGKVYNECTSTNHMSPWCAIAVDGYGSMFGSWDVCASSCPCKTVDGDKCIFPFTHNGKKYNHCTAATNNKAWCATKVDPTGEMDMDWGVCEAGNDACLGTILTGQPEPCDIDMPKPRPPQVLPAPPTPPPPSHGPPPTPPPPTPAPPIPNAMCDTFVCPHKGPGGAELNLQLIDKASSTACSGKKCTLDDKRTCCESKICPGIKNVGFDFGSQTNACKDLVSGFIKSSEERCADATDCDDMVECYATQACFADEMTNECEPPLKVCLGTGDKKYSDWLQQPNDPFCDSSAKSTLGCGDLFR